MTSGKMEGKSSRGRQRIKIQDGVTNWPGRKHWFWEDVCTDCRHERSRTDMEDLWPVNHEDLTHKTHDKGMRVTDDQWHGRSPTTNPAKNKKEEAHVVWTCFRRIQTQLHHKGDVNHVQGTVEKAKKTYNLERRIGITSKTVHGYWQHTQV